MARGLPVFARASMAGPPGVGKAQQAGDLVEGLAGRVVDGGAKQFHIIGNAADAQDLGMAAGDQQRAQVFRKHGDSRALPRSAAGHPSAAGTRAVVAGQGPRYRLIQQTDPHVRHQVVDRVERLPGGHGQRLGRADAHHQRPGQARPAGHRNSVHLVQRNPGLGQGLLQRGNDRIQVRPGGYLGDHAAKAHVLGHRRGNACW